MISDKDRSYYIGASDTQYVIGNWETKSFEKWYLEKMGLIRNTFKTEAMVVGTAYEHRILESLRIPGLQMDEQIIKGRLRVNLDGNTTDTIYEVKTFKSENKFIVSKAYRCQVNVEMYAFGIRKAYIVAYGLEKEDYDNFYRKIDEDRIKFFPIIYDHDFINRVYLPRLVYLSNCLDTGKFPQTKAVL